MNGRYRVTTYLKSGGLHAAALALLFSHSLLLDTARSEPAAYGSATAMPAPAPAAAVSTGSYSAAATSVGVAPPEMEKLLLPPEKLLAPATGKPITANIGADAASPSALSAAFLLLVEQGDRFRTSAPQAVKPRPPMTPSVTPRGAMPGGTAPQSRLLTSITGSSPKPAGRGVTSLAGGSSSASRNTTNLGTRGFSAPRRLIASEPQRPIAKEKETTTPTAHPGN